MCECQNEKNEKLNELLEKYKDDKSNLIRVLNDAQEIYGYLPIQVQEQISKKMNISMAEIYGVVTFYSRFTTEQKGKYSISICLGTACYVKGSEAILNRFKEKLGIKEGQCTPDGKFSIDVTRCIGACGSAPVFTVNDKVYTNATITTVDEVIEEYSNKD